MLMKYLKVRLIGPPILVGIGSCLLDRGRGDCWVFAFACAGGVRHVVVLLLMFLRPLSRSRDAGPFYPRELRCIHPTVADCERPACLAETAPFDDSGPLGGRPSSNARSVGDDRRQPPQRVPHGAPIGR